MGISAERVEYATLSPERGGAAWAGSRHEWAVVHGWARALALRDRGTEDHTRRVSRLAVALGRRLGLAGIALRDLHWGAILHDVGKIGIPDRILHKPGPLTPEEWAEMRRHPAHARRILAGFPFLHGAMEVPWCHHERWDGGGYPRALSGRAIPLSARVFAVADVWDALRSPRPYRPAWSRKDARDHVREAAGSHFDPVVVERFLEMEKAIP